MSLYERVMKAKPLFNSNEEALRHYTREYEALGAKYGKTGDEFWQEAEDANLQTEDHCIIHKLARSIQMCKHLINKEENG